MNEPMPSAKLDARVVGDLSTLPANAPPLSHPVGWRLMAAAACVIAVGELLLALAVGLDRPLRADEPHFVRNIIRFGSEPLSFDLVTHYDAMSAPLPFVLYGAWGRMFGFEPQTLRIFSLVVALATGLLWFWLLQSTTGKPGLSTLGTAFVLLHPYMLYLSVFVYTDMLAIACLIAALAAIRHERPLAMGLALCAATLNRQYLVFVTAAAGAYWLAGFVRPRITDLRRRGDLTLAAAAAASVVPLLGLCCLWRGLSPDGALRHVYPDARTTFHPESLVLYISLIALYMAPILIVRRREIFFHAKSGVALAAVLGWAYWNFPVAPSRPSVVARTFHVGMLHQALQRLPGGEWLAQCVFFLGFAAGLVVVTALARDMIERWRSRTIDFQFFLDLTVFAFLAVMPWSYLHWEKYLMPLLPVLTLRLLLPQTCTGRLTLTPVQEAKHKSEGKRLQIENCKMKISN
jgi:hypothetical protein